MIRVFSIIFIFFLLTAGYPPSTTFAIVDPLSVPNNKFGIHIISGTPDESSPSSSLVNSTGGDWGYITFLIESKDLLYAVPGGLIGCGLKVDPFLTRSDKLVGHILGLPG